MTRDHTTTLFGLGMIMGSLPCAIASFSVWLMTGALAQGRARGQELELSVVSDVVVVYLAFLLAFLLALLTTIAGLLRFGYIVLATNTALKAWHWFSIVNSLVHVAVAATWM